MPRNNLLYIGIKGTALALDRGTGQEVWRTPLKGSDFVNVALVDGDLYATSRGELFCLDAGTGSIRWKNPLTGFGLGLISIAAWDGQAVLLQEKRRREQAEAAASGD
jgi:outer membrane protein assembly factor BamB